MAMPDLDAAAKSRIKDALLASAQGGLSGLQEEDDADAEASDLVQDEAHTTDDLWQQQQAEDMDVLLEQAADRAQTGVEAIEALDMAPRTTVEPGAVVGIGGDNYVVGVVIDEVEVDGVSYSGMSTEAPLYQAAQGHAAGDSITVGDRELTIDWVA